jgi:DNA polymerase epsilon subunit 3
MDLPRNVVKKIVRAKLAERAEAQQRLEQGVGRAAGGKKRAAITPAAAPPQVAGDALLALAESARVFISYVTAAANDVAREHKRQTISAEDMLTALDDLDFGELLPELREALDARKKGAKDAADKAAKQKLAEREAKQQKKKREQEASEEEEQAGGAASSEEEAEEEEKEGKAGGGKKKAPAAAAAAGAKSPAAKKAKK